MMPEDISDWTLWHHLWWLCGSGACVTIMYMVYRAFLSGENGDDK